MTTPTLNLTEWAAAQASPWFVINAALRAFDFWSTGGAIVDRDLATPPGSPSDGDAYLVATSGTGAWSGKDGQIALYASGWLFFTAKEGMQLYVKDEDVRIIFDGANWDTPAGSSGAGDMFAANNLSDLDDAAEARENLLVNVATWDFNFADDGDAYIRAPVAMTLTEQDTSGTGTIVYQKSTAAAPDTFSSTSSPITLEAGAKLKVSTSSITGSVAVHLERTA